MGWVSGVEMPHFHGEQQQKNNNKSWIILQTPPFQFLPANLSEDKKVTERRSVFVEQALIISGFDLVFPVLIHFLLFL